MLDIQVINIPAAYYYYVLGAYLFFVFLMSVPCGYLRRGYRRWSRPCARTLYIPITVSIIMRSVLGLKASAIPFILAAFIAGFYVGGLVRARRAGSNQAAGSYHDGGGG